VPFIESCFSTHLDQAHIDLRYVLKSLGYSGGLKACEKKLGIDRGDLDGVDGYFAVILWKDYLKTKNPKSLETLLAYNIADVMNLEILMIKAFNMKIAGTPFQDSDRISLPDQPELPFTADMETVRRLKRENPFMW